MSTGILLHDKKRERAERQREYRASMRHTGHKRLDIYIPPKLWAKLEPHMEKHMGKTHPGHALVAWLEEELRD